MAKPTSDTFLKEMREAYDYAEAEWSPHRQEAAADMRIIAGDHWPPEERAARSLSGTLCVDFDEVNQHLNQTIGQQQMNEVGIGVMPEGDGSNDETALLEEDAIRSIEYESKASQARMWALTSAIHRGYGFTVLRREFIGGSFKQRLRLKAVQNPDTITFDGRSKELDGSDAKCAWVVNRIKRDEFVRRYGKRAKITNFEGVSYKINQSWIGADDVQIAEYWLKRERRAKLLQIKTANGIEEQFEKDLTDAGAALDGKNLYVPDDAGMMLPAGVVVNERWDQVPYVCQYMTNGLEILQSREPDDDGDGYETEWAGEWIPITPYYCTILYLQEGGQSKRVLESLHRRARGPQMAYSYSRTASLIAIGNQSKSPAVMYEGQDENHPEWANVNKVNYPYMVVKPYTEAHPTGSGPLPHPSRISYVADINASEVFAESCRRAIQAAIGNNPLPTSAQRQNEKSGVALDRIAESAAIGTYGVVDHYHCSIEHEGRMIEQLLPTLVKDPRVMRLRKADGTYEMKQVQPENFQAKHATTIKVQPAAQSQREAVEAFGDNLAANNPEVFARIGWLLVKLRNMGPIGDQISDLLKPADLKELEGGEDDPAAMAQKMGQMQQALQERDAMLQELGQKLQQFEAGLQVKQLEGEVKLQLQQMQDETTRLKAEQDDATKRWVAKLQADTDLAKLAVAHKFKTEEIDQQGEIDEDLAETEHEQGMEATEHMAELQPEPDSEGGEE